MKFFPEIPPTNKFLNETCDGDLPKSFNVKGIGNHYHFVNAGFLQFLNDDKL